MHATQTNVKRGWVNQKQAVLMYPNAKIVVDAQITGIILAWLFALASVAGVNERVD
jgi:hypothetical protein